MVEPTRRPFVVRAAGFAVAHGLKAIRHRRLRAGTAWRGFRYRMRETRLGNLAWRLAVFAGAPLESARRRRMAGRYGAGVPGAVMDSTRAFHVFPPGHFADLQPVIDTCRQLFEMKGVREHESADSAALSGRPLAEKRKFLRNLLDNEDLLRHPVLVDFALSDGALGLAAHYLGSIPRLTRVDLLYSVARESDDRIKSQLFHVDPEGVAQVKIFVNIFETGDREGPFTFIPADDTARILREVRKLRRKEGRPHVGRYLDEEIAAVGGTDAIVRVTGPGGAGVAVDTTRCLHLGSRVSPGAFRLCLYIQYCTTREHGNVFDIERYRRDPVRYLAVAHSTASRGATVGAPHEMAG